MKLRYDNVADVLYGFLGDPRPTSISEPEEGVFIRFDTITGQAVGFVIVDFRRQREAGFLTSIPFFPNLAIPQQFD